MKRRVYGRRQVRSGSAAAPATLYFKPELAIA
jgi:hypothetical protein